MSKTGLKLFAFAYATVYGRINSSLYRSRNVISKLQAPTHPWKAVCLTWNKIGINIFITEWKLIKMESKWIKIK